MAIDYSQLSDEELDAIAAGDYSRLSDATLQKLAGQPAPAAAAPTQQPPQPPAPGVADYAELAGLGVGIPATGYGAYKYYQNHPALQIGKKIAPRIGQALINYGQAAAAPATSGPVVDLRSQMTSRAPGPVAPQTMPAPTPQPAPQAAQPSILDKTTQMVRQLAASKVMQGAARVAGAAGAALTPSNVGQNYPFPTSGPLRGSELNPATGRPWTPQELAAYRAQYGQ